MDARVLIGLIIVALVVIALVVWSSMRKRRSEELRERFGLEYDRAVEEHQDRRSAEGALKEREERVEALQIRPLSAEQRGRFDEGWRSVQAQFVDDPTGATTAADRLVAEVMEARGYPVGDFEQRAADISVGHPQVVEHYRAAHQIALRNERGEASTEDLRQALVHYRALFQDLLGTRETAATEVQR
jgi:hypothetical protein